MKKSLDMGSVGKHEDIQGRTHQMWVIHGAHAYITCESMRLLIEDGLDQYKVHLE